MCKKRLIEFAVFSVLLTGGFASGASLHIEIYHFRSFLHLIGSKELLTGVYLVEFLNLISSLLSKLLPEKKRRTAAVYKTVSKPADEVSYYRSGIEKYNSAQYQGAIEDFSKAVSIRGNFHQAFCNRGLTKLKIEDNYGADLDFSRAIEIHPKYAKAYLNRGVAKKKLGDPEGAKQDFIKAVKIDPKLYSFFKVKKKKAGKNSPQDVPDGTLLNEGEKFCFDSEFIKTALPEELEYRKIPGPDASNEEDGFMKPLAFESEDDGFIMRNPLPDEKDDIIPSRFERVQSDKDAEEAFGTSEFKFQEFTPEDELNGTPSGIITPSEAMEEEEKPYSAGTTDTGAEEPLGSFTRPLEQTPETESADYEPQKTFAASDEKPDDVLTGKPAQLKNIEDDFEDLLRVPLQAENENEEDEDFGKYNPIDKDAGLIEEEQSLLKKSSGQKQAFDETDADDYKARLEKLRNFSETYNPMDDLKKYNLAETADEEDGNAGDDEIISVSVSDEEIAAAENEMSQETSESGKSPENKSRRKPRISNIPSTEERIKRKTELSEQDIIVDLPERDDIQRVLANTIPEQRIQYARGFYYRAKSKLKDGDKEGAMQDLSSAIEFYPKFSQAFLQRGKILAELNELQNAIDDYSRAIEYNHRNPAAYFQRALSNQKSGKNREALADFTKAILFEPRNPQLYLFRGMLRYRMGQSRAAFDDWGRAEMFGLTQARELLNKYTPKPKGAGK